MNRLSSAASMAIGIPARKDLRSCGGAHDYSHRRDVSIAGWYQNPSLAASMLRLLTPETGPLLDEGTRSGTYSAHRISVRRVREKAIANSARYNEQIGKERIMLKRIRGRTT